MDQAVSPSINTTRERLEQGLLAKFGEAFEKASQQANAITDPARRELGAARIALEHAVLQTALEKDMPTKSVASMLEKASPMQVAHFIREGRKSIQKTYGVDANAMVAALSAQVAKVDLHRGLAQTEAMRDLVERGRSLASQAVSEAYQLRGRLTQELGARSDVIAPMQSALGESARDQLKNHMVFIESAIDNAVKSGRMNAEQGAMLRERTEHQVFHAPADTKLAPQFKAYYESAGQSMRKDVMAEARRITKDKTIGEIAERLHEARERVSRMRSAHERD